MKFKDVVITTSISVISTPRRPERNIWNSNSLREIEGGGLNHAEPFLSAQSEKLIVNGMYDDLQL